MKEWVNWSGSLRFKPEKFLQPKDDKQLADIIRQSRAEQKNVRLAAAGHSSSPLVETRDTLVNLDNFKGLVRYDEKTATLKAGMTVHESNMALQKVGLALFNTGDVD